jgi:hypothetical protein
VSRFWLGRLTWESSIVFDQPSFTRVIIDLKCPWRWSVETIVIKTILTPIKNVNKITFRGEKTAECFSGTSVIELHMCNLHDSWSVIERNFSDSGDKVRIFSMFPFCRYQTASQRAAFTADITWACLFVLATPWVVCSKLDPYFRYGNRFVHEN